MATQAEAAEHRSLVEDFATLAVADLVAAWDSLPTDADALREPLRDLMGELAATYASMSAASAADWYDDLRAATVAAGLYVATVPEIAPVEQVQSAADWATAGVRTSPAKALADAATALDRLVNNADRSTVEWNADRDPARPRWARYASASACAFCALVATRGPVYRTEESAAGKYHNHCKCLAVPVWRPDDYQEMPYVADWREAYYDATERLGGASSTKAILADMRANAGFR